MRVFAARTRRHVSSAILFPFPFIAALFRSCSLNTNIICYLLALFILLIIFAYALGTPPSCSRASIALLQFFSLLFTFIYFFVCFSFLFVRSSPCYLISLAIWYSARFAIPHDIASRVLHAAEAQRPIGCQTFAGSHESGSKFSIRTTFLSVSADLSVCGREITRSPHTRRAGAIFHFSFILPRYFARAKTLHYIGYLTPSLAERTFAIPVVVQSTSCYSRQLSLVSPLFH